MTPWTGIVFIWGLSMLPLMFFVTLYYADRFSNRKAEERAAERADRQMMLSRIQDPVQAVAVHSVQAARASMPEPAQRVEYDSDDSFWDSLGVDPLAGPPTQNGHTE